MIITISGIAGSGKSTIAKLLAKKLDYRHYSVGDFMRELARQRSLTLLELSREAEQDKGIDLELDRKQIEIGKTEDNFVIDSRLGFHFIPSSVKVFLDVELNEAARRIFDEKRQHEQYRDIQESIEKIKARIRSEGRRYKEYYDIDYRDKKHYDIIIDTTSIKPEEAVRKILDSMKSKKSLVTPN
ncbi:cytidylate kinase family protein [Candidatus Woesearchaeota archaeon]|nr:cytidylate kinase family protein [Candidatus Woesearchaeota archaeon]